MRERRSSKSRAWTIVRRLALAMILVLVGRYVWQHLTGIRELEFTFTPLRLALAAAFGLGWILMQSLLWRLVLGSVGAGARLPHAIAQVWLPNLGKYIPGKVWAAVGRVYLCRQTGIPVAQGSVALALENVSYILAGAIFAAVTVSLAAMVERDTIDASRLLVPLLAIVTLGLVLVHPRVWGGAAAFVLRRLGREPFDPRVTYGRSLALVFGYVVSWSVLGVGMCMWVASIMPMSVGMGMRVAGLYVVAWSLGYMSMLAPAGIGVREGIMMAGLAGSMGPEAAVAVSLGLRIYFTLIDVAGSVLAVAVAPGLARRLAGADLDGEDSS